MSVEKPNLWRVLSDTSRIISSNSLHFLALSLLFIFPLSLFNIIHTSTLQQPSPFHSHYRRLLSTVSKSDSEIPAFDKSQILFQFLYGLLILIFNLCSVSSITHSIFHGFHSKPIQLTSSLKSILSSFFPLLATRIAYLIILAAISLGFGICMGFVFFGLALMGFEMDASNKSLMAVVAVMMIPFLVMLVYLEVKWFLMDAIVVVESKYGFATFERSSNLVKGARGVGLLMMLLFTVLHMILSGWYSALGVDGGCSGGVAVQMVAYAGLSTVVSLFGLGAKTVLFVYCKLAFNGNQSEKIPSDEKFGQVYVQLPHHDVVDEV